MDIKSWILLIGTLLIVAVICHGFWTAYRTRKNDVRMDIETDLPEGDLDDMVLLSGELPNGGARVTPTVGYDALLVKERRVREQLPDAETAFDDALISLDDAVAFSEEGLSRDDDAPDEGNSDAGYQPEQATLDLELGALEERYAARAAAAANTTRASHAAHRGSDKAPLLTDAELNSGGEPSVGRDSSQTSTLSSENLSPENLPPKKMITPEIAAAPPRKQFEPPLPEEVEAARKLEAQQAQERAAVERAELKQQEIEAAAREQAQREAAHLAKVEAQRLQKIETEQREAQAKADAQARREAKAAKLAEKKAELAARQRAVQAAELEPQQLSLTAEPVVEFPEATGRQAPNPPPAEELVVLNVIAKSQAFHGGDVLELFLRNGIKFGDMNIFHRIDPVSRASQYSIASVTEPGFFDLRTMESLEFRGLCLFMQLPCSGQATKVFTDMLTVADKLARQLDAEVCDEQFNRLTRQSTEHYRQRVAEFTRRHMSKRAL